MRAFVSCARLVRAHWPAIVTAMALAAVTTALQTLVALALRDVIDMGRAAYPWTMRLGALDHVFDGIAVTVVDAAGATRAMLGIMAGVVGVTAAAACTGCARPSTPRARRETPSRVRIRLQHGP